MAALFPYLSVYIKGLGVSADEIAMLGALTPVIALVMRPAFALLADKTGFHKLITHLCYLLTAAGFTLLLFIPARSTPPAVQQTGNSSFTTAHGRPDWFQLQIVPDKTLLIIALVRFMAFLFFHPSFNLSDALVYSVIGNNHRLFGYIRIFGSFGFLLVACLGGGLAVVFRKTLGAASEAAAAVTAAANASGVTSSADWFNLNTSTLMPPTPGALGVAVDGGQQQCKRHSDLSSPWRYWHMVAMIVLLDVLLVTGATSIFGFRTGKVHAHNRLLANVGQVLRNVDLLVMMCFLLLSGILNTMYEALIAFHGPLYCHHLPLSLLPINF